MPRFRRAALLALFVMIALFFPILAPPPHRIDEEHLALIREGMTEADVEGIFGVPAGYYDGAVVEDVSAWDFFEERFEDHQKPVVFHLNMGESLVALKRVPYFIDRPIVGPAVDPPVARMWVSRHGAFCIAVNATGTVCAKGQLGTTRIEPPWQRWWRKFIAK
jgi:hypothetical protein